MSQITTISLFKYKGFKNKLWAFGMMQFAHTHLKEVKGLSFYKLWGSGKDGFSPLPDWNIYALIQVWDNAQDAEHFFSKSYLMQRYAHHTEELWTLYLKNEKSRGEWSESNPFRRSKTLDISNPYVVAITRATIKTKMLVRFWKYVPKSQRGLFENGGLLYTKGFGEVPIRNMATFSVWKDRKALDSFAYQKNPHVGAIKETRKLDWYKEELFSRFQPYKSIGTWFGKNPLPSLDPNQKKVDKEK
ncbi:DUF3291 domain-containing protein [Muricauda sp. JGD-17]|uniref:DUF3291 domain-containing protein n=1 Tax=Flagellimonas ochracea TaxID=2696472 RepID=A0A964WYL2_9FLAO|nr:DUF3291 domain-containing protein [Allomuricauda ochracea]NAY93310.1 DUF3291 domain-containing protein [Allomuricauda ochracea]